MEDEIMLTITKTPEDLRLLEAAEIAEESEQYNQGSFGCRCGAPACMLGGYAWKYPKSAARAYISCKDSGLIISRWKAVGLEFGVNMAEFDMLFGGQGCGDAGQDGLKAAAFVRKFVEDRCLARLEKANAETT
jgi:hypothetical protein